MVVLMYVSVQIFMLGCQLISWIIIELHDKEKSFEESFCVIKADRLTLL